MNRWKTWLMATAALFTGVVQPPAPVTPAPGPRPLKIRAEAVAIPTGAGKDRPTPYDAYVLPDPLPGVVPEDRQDALMAMDDALTDAYAFASSWAVHEGLAFMGYPYLAELAQRPEYRRGVEIIANEMTRKWIKFSGTGTSGDKTKKIAKLTKAMEAFGIQQKFRVLAEKDGYFGRSHLYVDTGYTDDRDELSTLLMVDRRKVGKGGVKGFRVVEPIWTYPNAYNSNDPLAPNFYQPQQWFVMGKLVHRSRLLTFVGRPVPDILKPAYTFGGLALTQMAKPYVDNWIRTRQSISNLLHSFSTSVLKTNMESELQDGGTLDNLTRRAQMFTQYRDNQGLFLLDKDTEEFDNIATPLGTVDKLQAQSQEQMAAVFGIPLVILLGITPSGLNASSDGEIKTFYAWIKSRQEQFFRPHLTTVIHLIQLHLFGAIDPDIIFDFDDLWEMDAVQAATIRKSDSDAGVALVDAGIIGPEEERKRLATDETSAYHGLDLAPDAVPEPPDDGGGDDDEGGDGDGQVGGAGDLAKAA